ncbi:MAG TPA: hypothetical protein VMX17_11050 [Candidatus Glassbacteria bacterium]|nr:hypothetical protein [Candidatus Glassbacteria bacterium]
MNKKGQASGGLITGLVMGIAGLVIGVIVALVIVSTLTGAGLLESTSNSVTNETGAYLNVTGYTLAGASATGNPRGYTITAVWNTTSAVLYAAGNYTVSAAGVLTNASTGDFSTGNYGVNVSYTYTTDGTEEGTVGSMSGNFTSGIDEVSSKLPTVLLIAAIVLILGILAVLVGVWQRMKLGQGGL